jgi:HEAT repeat protein
MTSDGLNRDRASIADDLLSSDEEVRRLAVERLLSLPSDEAIPKLVDALGDESWRVRKAAVGRLATCSNRDEVVEFLITALADDENTGRRNSAVEALVHFGSSAVPALIRSLGSDDIDVRKLVVDSIAGIADDDAREAVIGVLGDSDPNVRAAAADALGNMSGAGVADALRDVVMAQSEEGLIRLSALRSLARLEVSMTPSELASAFDDSLLCPAAYTVVGYCEDENVSSCLLKGLVSGTRLAREAAMESLVRVLSCCDGAQADQVVDGILEVVASNRELIQTSIERLGDADLASRLVLIQFLGIIRAPEAVIPILDAGRDEAIAEVAHTTLESLGEIMETAIDTGWANLDVELRTVACDLLGRTRGARGAELLLSALDDSDGELRGAAARALGVRRYADALPVFVRRLESAALEEDFESEEEVASFVEGLVALASPDGDCAPGITAQAVGLLSERLSGAADAVRLSIATVLGRIGRPEDAELVSSLLKDPSSLVRRAAVGALSRLEPGTASEPLRLALADESALVRVTAASALGASENSQVIDDLQRLLHDEDGRVCAAALRAIGSHCASFEDAETSQKAVALIEQSLEGDGIVAMAAVEALGRVGGVEAASVAVGALDRSEPELVQTAVSCIGQHGDRAAVSELIGLVSHESWSVRSDVIQTLADRRVAQAVPAILRRLETEQDSFVRDTILRALKRLEA